MPHGQPVCFFGFGLRPQSLESLLLLLLLLQLLLLLLLIFEIGASICPWYSMWSRGLL